MPLRLIFMGTPDFAVPTLLQLVAHGHEVAADAGGAGGATPRDSRVDAEDIESA